MSHHPSVVVIPCSGIGKTFGTVSREAAYELVRKLPPSRHKLGGTLEAGSWRGGCAMRESVATRRSPSTAAS